MRNVPVRTATLVGLLGVGLLLVAWGAIDIVTARRPWSGDFRFESDKSGAQRSAVATFSRRPYARILRRSPQGENASDEIVIRVDANEFETEPAFVDILTISMHGEEREVTLDSEASFLVDGETVTLHTVRPFVGLLSDTQGMPMVNLSIRLGGTAWLENVLLMNRRWRRIENGPALRLIWCADEQEAERLAASGRPGLDEARWGVHDQGRTHWFETFVPGAGVELDDGTLVTLVGLNDEDGGSAVLEVDVTKSGGVSRKRIIVNTVDPLLAFEHPGIFPALLQVYAWTDDRGLVTYVNEGDVLQRSALNGGESWTPEGSELTLRLEQAMREAVPVANGQHALYEVALDTATRRVRVRQGEAARVGDALLRYGRRPVLGAPLYLIELDDGMGRDATFDLSPGERYDFQSPYGPYSLHYRDIDPGGRIVIRPGRRYSLLTLFAGFLAVFLAAVGGIRSKRAAR